MNIILVLNSTARTRSIPLPLALLLIGLLSALPALMLWVLIVPQGTHQHKALQPSTHFSNAGEQVHIDALAQQLGEIEAKLLRLDTLGARLSSLAGVKASDIDTLPPGRGGPMVDARTISEKELEQRIQALTQSIDLNIDRLGVFETSLLQQRLKASTLPSTMPTDVVYNSSSYGWRVDPFSGKVAFHEGLDFVAANGAPVYASAAGVVMAAEQTHDYGRIVKVNHGSGLETRYAHASKLLVKAGERVERGQLIARVGSTGRSTGTHLHFEVRLNGAALDPRKYLQSTN